jgi:hypothetical protein
VKEIQSVYARQQVEGIKNEFVMNQTDVNRQEHKELLFTNLSNEKAQMSRQHTTNIQNIRGYIPVNLRRCANKSHNQKNEL